MPLRDHFRPPVSEEHDWEAFFGGWPAVNVQQMRKTFPPGFSAGPRIHLGAIIEPDDVPAPLPDQYEYAVHIYDTAKGRRLVGAVEFVSPANKDRPAHRAAFVAKCSALLQQDVAVTIVDLVTTKNSNQYLDLLETLGQTDPTVGNPPPHMYAVTCRAVNRGTKPMLEVCSNRLDVGRPLPALPLWLAADRAVLLDLEASYEQACHDLWIA